MFYYEAQFLSIIERLRSEITSDAAWKSNHPELENIDLLVGQLKSLANFKQDASTSPMKPTTPAKTPVKAGSVSTQTTPAPSTSSAGVPPMPETPAPASPAPASPVKGSEPVSPAVSTEPEEAIAPKPAEPVADQNPVQPIAPKPQGFFSRLCGALTFPFTALWKAMKRFFDAIFA